jgi:hypothetical protein
MESISVEFEDGRSVAFDVETGLEGPAFFSLSIRKCGSSIFNNITKALSLANQRNFVDVGDTFFRQNITELEWIREPGLRAILRPGNVYGGFRSAPETIIDDELFRSSPKILFVRDLRDALVSLYFSNAYSHPIPQTGGEGEGNVTELLLRLREEARTREIDAVVIRSSGAMLRTAMAYEEFIDSPSLTILRYEDYIFDKSGLMDVIVDRFGWQLEAQVREDILGWADVRPVEEDPTLFIRRVTPGDHIEKLKPETIEQLNETLAPALEMFGYDTG